MSLENTNATDNTNASGDSTDQNTLLTDNQDGGQQQEVSFIDSLSIKNDAFSEFKSADELAQAFLNQTDEYNNLKSTTPQVPNSPDEYTFEGEGDIDEEAMSAFKKFAHENGLPQSAFQNIIDFDIARYKQHIEATQAAEEQGIDSLKNEWKNKFDENIELARKSVKHFGGETLTKYLDESRLGNHPEMIKMFNKIGTLISDDTVHSGAGSANTEDVPRMEDGKRMLKFPSMQN